jgi:predicted alpha/beta-fold hydrolase
MTTFRPFPLLGNPHVQTVLGNLLSGAKLTFPSVAETVPLADGDRVVIHDSTPPDWHPGGPVVVLVHGLGGCHTSGYMVRISQRLAMRGIRVCRMDMRGCGAGEALARRLYSAACSDDVRDVLEYLHARFPHSPMALAGFSLGGGIVAKLAGEAGERPVAGLCAVASVGAPLDLERCSGMIARQRFYDQFYVRHLTEQVHRLQSRNPHVPRVEFPRRITLRQFDDLYTAPGWGFADSTEYYRKASSLPWVPKARVPTFLLTARDDPFIAVEPFEQIPPAPHLEVHISAHGGHLGFLGADGEGGSRWAERRVVDWLIAKLNEARTQ